MITVYEVRSIITRDIYKVCRTKSAARRIINKLNETWGNRDLYFIQEARYSA